MTFMQRIPFSFILKASFVGLFFAVYSSGIWADEVDDFIQDIQVSTYNCPDDEYMPLVEQY